MHRLVCIGDSISQGFKNGAIFEPNLSYPAIIAWEMGIADADFRYPSFSGCGGLPLNIEYILRKLDHEFGPNVAIAELPLAAFRLREMMDETEDYWERGPGAEPIGYKGNYSNLSIWGFELQDAYQVTAEMCLKATRNATDNWAYQVPERAMFRTAMRVLNPDHSASAGDKGATQVSRARQLATTDGGIENLVVCLGANNVLSTVTQLKYQESTDKDVSEKNPSARTATIYTPAHFEKLLEGLVSEVEKLSKGGGSVERVFWGTVPPVTIPPITNGVGGRMHSDLGLESPFGPNDDAHWYRRYFKYYTRPWISDRTFNRVDDPHLTGEQAMCIDRTIAYYNGALEKKIAEHNEARQTPDWFIVDIHWALERVAFRRYMENPSVPPPPNWSPYELPSQYAALKLDTRFLRASDGKRIAGGLFSLDGVHPTTAGYGLVAQEFINKMQSAGVPFYWGDGVTRRHEPVIVDFDRLLRLDTLVNSPPQTLDDLWAKLVDGDQLLDLFKRAVRFC